MQSDNDFETTIKLWNEFAVLTINEAALLWTHNTPPDPQLVPYSKEFDDRLIPKGTSDSEAFGIYYAWLKKNENDLENLVVGHVTNRALFDQVRIKIFSAITYRMDYEKEISEIYNEINTNSNSLEKTNAEKRLKIIEINIKEDHMLLTPKKCEMRIIPLYHNLKYLRPIDPNKTIIFRDDLAKWAKLNNFNPDFLMEDIQKLKKRTRKHCDLLKTCIGQIITDHQGDSRLTAREILGELEKRYTDDLTLEISPNVDHCEKIDYIKSNDLPNDITFSRFSSVVSEVRKELGLSS